MSTAIINQRNKIDPKYFALLVGCSSIVMMFTAFTSAYIVRQAGGNWLEFSLPSSFTYSTIILISSSIFLHFSYISFTKAKELPYKLFLLLAFGFALFFLYLQYNGWLQMKEMGVSLNGNPSGSFVYVISGVHAAHIIGGIGAFIMAIIHAFMLDFFVTDKRKNRFKMVVTYWHFVDIIWIYLFIFFNVQR